MFGKSYKFNQFAHIPEFDFPKPEDFFHSDPFGMDAHKNIKDYVPSTGEKFSGVMISSHSSYSDVDGLITKSGGADKVINVNGAVDEKNVHFHETDSSNIK